jgi:hypothetical protein
MLLNIFQWRNKGCGIEEWNRLDTIPKPVSLGSWREEVLSNESLLMGQDALPCFK